MARGSRGGRRAALIQWAKAQALLQGCWVAIDGSKFRAVSSKRSVAAREALARSWASWTGPMPPKSRHPSLIRSRGLASCAALPRATSSAWAVYWATPGSSNNSSRSDPTASARHKEKGALLAKSASWATADSFDTGCCGSFFVGSSHQYECDKGAITCRCWSRWPELRSPSGPKRPRSSRL